MDVFYYAFPPNADVLSVNDVLAVVSERRCSPERGCREATGVERDLHKQKKPSRKAELLSFVEMGGLEPPSKHRTRQLSTRLV